MIIRKLDVFSVAITGCVFSGFLTFIYSTIAAMVFISTSEVTGIGLAFFTMTVYPLLGFLTGLVSGAIFAWCFNVACYISGGIKIDLEMHSPQN